MAVELRRAEQRGLVRLIDEVPYQRAIAPMHGADVLVLLQSPSDGQVQAVAGKTYDYSRGPTGSRGRTEGDNLALIRAHAAVYEHADDTVAALADAIGRLYAKWRGGELAVIKSVPEALPRSSTRCADGATGTTL